MPTTVNFPEFFIAIRMTILLIHFEQNLNAEWINCNLEKLVYVNTLNFGRNWDL